LTSIYLHKLNLIYSRTKDKPLKFTHTTLLLGLKQPQNLVQRPFVLEDILETFVIGS